MKQNNEIKTAFQNYRNLDGQRIRSIFKQIDSGNRFSLFNKKEGKAFEILKLT